MIALAAQSIVWFSEPPLLSLKPPLASTNKAIGTVLLCGPAMTVAPAAALTDSPSDMLLFSECCDGPMPMKVEK